MWFRLVIIWFDLIWFQRDCRKPQTHAVDDPEMTPASLRVGALQMLFSSAVLSRYGRCEVAVVLRTNCLYRTAIRPHVTGNSHRRSVVLATAGHEGRWVWNLIFPSLLEPPPQPPVSQSLLHLRSPSFCFLRTIFYNTDNCSLSTYDWS
jgi:hypothetical protein